MGSPVGRGNPLSTDPAALEECCEIMRSSSEKLSFRSAGSRGIRDAAKQLARLLCLVGLVLLADAIHARIPARLAADRGEIFVPDPSLVQAMALGFDAVVADYYWLQAIQAVGGDIRITPELAGYLGRLIDVVTTLDPWVDHAYRFAAIWMTESEENVRDANRLLARGIAHHPEEWRNHFYLGFNHFYYLLENERAAEALARASELPGSPPYLARLVARLRSTGAGLEVAEIFLRQLVEDTDDEAIRAGYQAALDEIEVEYNARFLERARESFRSGHGRDIADVNELLQGESPILEGLPSPEPDSLPASLTRHSKWQLDPEDNRIVSSYYGHRYRLQTAKDGLERAQRWADQRRLRERARQGRGAPEAGAMP